MASVEERQNLSLEQVECIHDFSIEVSRGAIRELDLDCTPGLQPLSVVWRNSDLEDWHLLPAAPGQQERRLHIRLPEALQSGQSSLRIRAIAAGPLNQVWHSPELRLQNAVVLSESLTVQVAPELELTDWHSGRFDLMKTLTDASGCYLLQMQAGPFEAGRETGEDAGRPRAWPRLQAVQATAQLQLWWDIGPSGERLMIRARVEPRGGPLFRLLCRIPAGWRVERTDVQPAGLLADWTVLESDQASSLIVLHLNEAIEISQAATVFLSLSRPPQSATGSEQTFSLPRIGFPQVLSQDCSLGVSVASQLRVKSAPTSIYWQRSEANGSFPDGGQGTAGSEKPLWEKNLLWGLAHFHGLPPAGQMVVEGLVPRVKMRSICRVDLSLDQPRVGLRLEVEQLAGAPQSFDVHFSGSDSRRLALGRGRWPAASGSRRPLVGIVVPAWHRRRSVRTHECPRPHAGQAACMAFHFSRTTCRTPRHRGSADRRTIGPALASTASLQVGDMVVAGEIELRGAADGRATVETRGLTESPTQTASADHPDFSHFLYERGQASLEIRLRRARSSNRRKGRASMA